MKTPEEIKKGLECCIPNPLYRCIECPYDREGHCDEYELRKDALAYIQQLEEGIDRVYEQAKSLRLQISNLKDQIANAGRMATMKEVAEYAKSIGLTGFYYGGDEDG